MSKININKTNDIEALRQTQRNNAGKTQKAKSTPTTNNSEVGKDNLQFSSRATELGKLIAQVKDLPEVRESKVQSFKAQIAANEYNPSNEEVAEALLNDEES